MDYSKNIYYLFFIYLLFSSCTEPFQVKSLNYEDYLVIESTITNEFKKHQIKLSRTFKIDSSAPKLETNASVHIVDNNQVIYNFKEINDGVYESEIAFAAEENKEYTLKIKTTNNETYTSTPEKLTSETKIDNISYILEENKLGEKGVTFNVNSFNPKNDAKYYRYEYEETYKIIPPRWSELSLKIISETFPYKVETVANSLKTKICYKTQNSKGIIITETASLSEDRVKNFPVRFIANTNYIISQRYSILVKQYVQNFYSYNYYNTLKNFTSDQSFFSQIQTGFLEGNLSSESDPNKKAIGFFEVSSVSSKRLFINRKDITDKEPEPDFIEECRFIAPRLVDPISGESYLIKALKEGYLYYAENDLGSPDLEGPYLLVKKICGDCNELGTNIKPPFWID
ncbi:MULTISPECIES: DUF4249 domain-containing protein [unclassified Tenacibaculum]|uniref:DUF4249 domain-containing protein n=1 Tax=unclassified Tenacibaculum TaxID=2635139 RepID=UPI001F41E5BB|nr:MULTISPECIES: DUF4249 domain-containing protein [unclassified Tenacibaculum]MCF2873201.1 DUF4249 domain-containing protein [Tenacibaculum sp. Cn5-1]MCF2933357.1 DUF4249 domain-containing protein [Tenacibaculum sp. Cn5-34]MCG7510062.1 DUF4249 domain-containing protein [Tenacibaculum sp. Cn5-46]